MTFDELVEKKLAVAFGCSLYSWPPIPARRPRWWEFDLKARERRINGALGSIFLGPITDEMRVDFWRQVAIGQDVYEDAGGFIWRCWAAALGLRYRAALAPYKDIPTGWKP